ncbi:MAG: hypothetical protein R2830_12580 [Saprospiraceae bacterium]
MNVKKRTPKIIYWIVGLTALTILRAQTIFFFPLLEMNGGDNPNAWFAPWVSDTILGLLVPVVIYFLLKGKGVKTWALLIMYSAIGAFDYANGLAAQWHYPMAEKTASSALVFGSLSFTLTIQTIAVILLFRKEVMNHFFKIK